jgi:hypothetical protein
MFVVEIDSPAAAMEPGRFQGMRNPPNMWITLRRKLGLEDFFFVFGQLLRFAAFLGNSSSNCFITVFYSPVYTFYVSVTLP